MSNRFGARLLGLPGPIRALDLTDLFLFASAPVKSALIFDVNPFPTGADFDPKALYRVKAREEPAR
jgi:hypothetical protein